MATPLRSMAPPSEGPADAGVEALVRAAQGGEKEAFAKLHGLYARMVHAILLARVPRDDADDLVQDVFVSAIDRLSGLRDPRTFGGWLATIARNRAVDFLRRRKDHQPLGDEERGRPRLAPVEQVEASEVLAKIRALPEAYRETLLMRLCEGMSGAEIAERTGLEPGSVRVNLHRGMKLLKEALGASE